MSRFLLALVLTGCAFAAAPTPPADPLGRLNPRATVTGFLQACQRNDYSKASQYLDLSQIPAANRGREAPKLAKDLESLLDENAQFDPLAVTQKSEATPDNKLTIATIKRNDREYPLKLQLEPQKTGPALWLVAPDTVALLPKLAPAETTESAIAARLPRGLVANELAGTPIWKWMALLLAGLAIAVLSRLAIYILSRLLSPVRRGFWTWIEPVIVIISAAVFRGFEEVVRPAAISRLYINRCILLIIVAALGWALANLVELFLTRLDRVLDPRQRMVSHSLLYLARRTARVTIFVFVAVIVLDNWGFPMTTIIAGLGVGGIAVALAAQQTIANVFGGVSVIGDHPVMVGDFGNFGGVLGFVDDIGLRSTRIRTLSRTIVSIPNSSFAGMNLENYSVRDKMLFNPTLSVRRTTPKDQMQRFIDGVNQMLHSDKRLDPVPTSVRVTAISAISFSVEIFCYVRTADADAFYRVASDLYMNIHDELAAAGVELV